MWRWWTRCRPSQQQHADRGTLLHDAIADILDGKREVETYVGRKHEEADLTQELIDEKMIPALAALDAIDPEKLMAYMVETRVGFGDLLPDVFG